MEPPTSVRPVEAPVAPAAPLGPAEPPEVRRDPRAKTAWEIIRKENREHKATIETLRRQAADAQKALEESRAQKTTREQELEAQNEALETQIGRYSLRATKEFRNRYIAPINQEYGKAAAALQKAGMSQEEARNLISKLSRENVTGDEIDAATSDLPRWAQSVVTSALMSAQEYRSQAQEAESTWRQTKAALEADSERQVEAATKRSLAQYASTSVQELSEQYGSWVFRSDPGNPEWMKQRERLVMEAQHVLQHGTDQEITRNVIEGRAAAVYRILFEQKDQEARALRAELDALESARPRVGAGGPNALPAAPKAPERKPLTIEQGLRAAWNSRGQPAA